MNSTAKFCFIVMLGGGLLQAAHCQVNAYWKADGNALDSSGSGNNGTLMNGAGYGPGKFGQAFELNGVNQYVNVPSPSFHLGASDWTISVWANFSSFSFGSAGNLPNTLIAQDEGGGSQNKWAVYYNANTNALGFHLNSPIAGVETFREQPLSASPSTGVWNMFSLTESGHTLSFYYDGALLGSQFLPQDIPSVSAPITIGEAEGIGYFHGGLDDIRIYGRALDGSQISQIYSQAVPEPQSVILLATGALGLVLALRRKA